MSDLLSHSFCTCRFGNASVKKMFEFASRIALEIQVSIPTRWDDCRGRPSSPKIRLVVTDQMFPDCRRGGDTLASPGVGGRTTVGTAGGITCGMALKGGSRSSGSMGDGDCTTAGT
jgi:hypothetical protein